MPPHCIPSTSRTPSRSEGEEFSRKRKRKTEKDKINGILDTALATLKNFTDEPAQEQCILKHASFGRFIVDELEKIEDEVLLDELKENIIQNIFSTKRRRRDLRK
ncbi:uncharacterized protein LOC108912711 [Anoplophora glabripennis]|uniref:uncharacterized protein LOC108912711 n=1 Tax=Anoplophora glabripennis TaxID=217634 RepID=UPI0008754C99|nr:uncharacterized protein LOC108912711 [Anoplophora glabripennis]XP_018573550.1 uncharacterized protein LOC108912711 [Anoplophora glabripennis]